MPARLLLTLVSVAAFVLALAVPAWADEPPDKSDNPALRLRGGIHGVTPKDELEPKLHAVDQLRTGFDTNFDEAARQSKELLAQYAAPEQQARIYFMWVHVLGQSGIPDPALQVELAQKALSLPLDEERRLQLYMYWGNALEVALLYPEPRAVTGEALAAARPKIVVQYLKAITECTEDIAVAENTPIVIPPVPMGNNVRGPSPEARAQNAIRNAEVQRDRKLKRLRAFQAAFENQTALLYSKQPSANAEILKMAHRYLPDEAARPSLMTRVVEEIEKREAQERARAAKVQ